MVSPEVFDSRTGSHYGGWRGGHASKPEQRYSGGVVAGVNGGDMESHRSYQLILQMVWNTADRNSGYTDSKISCQDPVHELKAYGLVRFVLCLCKGPNLL